MSTPSHDLRRDIPWIPVAYLDGTTATLALQPLLEQAHLIREVHAEPLTWAALMRFLPSVTALIAREDRRADFDEWADTGIPASHIDTALGSIASHLWLSHPDTPFMQEPLLMDKKPSSLEWLHLAPGVDSKAWWGKDGDTVHRDAGTLSRIVQGLVVSWYFSPGMGGMAVGAYSDRPEQTWRPRGTLGLYNHGLRVFARGRNLAETLLANTMESHLAGGRTKNLPMWATTGEILPTAPLTTSTWTGSVYRLAWEDGVPVGVMVGGRRIPGAPQEKPSPYASQIEKAFWRADPTIPRRAIVKAGEETSEVTPIRALHPSASTLQWMVQWYAGDQKHTGARPMEPGLIEVTNRDVLAIRVGGTKAPELDYVSRVTEASEVTGASVTSRLNSLTATTILPIKTTLYVGLKMALGKKAADPLHDRLFAAFCQEAEPVLDEIIHAPAFERTHAEAFAAVAASAFSRFVGPYLNSRTVRAMDSSDPDTKRDGIAAAIAHVERRVASTARTSA